MPLFKKLIALPQTETEYDYLVARVCDKFGLTDTNHASALISVAIRRLDMDKAHTTMEYLGHFVKKNIANYIASRKADQLKHEAEVTALYNLLLTEPGNNQARDALIKAANEGSLKAKSLLEALDPTDNVTQIAN